MEKRKVLLLDVDEVICFSGFVEAVNAFLGTNYVVDDFTDYYIDEVAIPKDRLEEFTRFKRSINFYENPHMLPNAVEVIRELNDIYDIYICSSCVCPFDKEGSGKMFSDKYNFLLKVLPFIDPEKRFIFTGAKHLIKADIQIDDRLPNLDNDVAVKILFPSYHNKDITDEELTSKKVIRAGNDWRNGWSEVKRILLTRTDEMKLELKNKDI